MYRNPSFIYILLAFCIFCGCEFRGDGDPVLDDIRITLGVDETPGYMNPRQFYHIELIMHFEGGSGYTTGIDVLVDGELIYEQKELFVCPPHGFPSWMKLERSAEFWRPVEFDAGRKVLLTIRLHTSSGILDEGAEVVVQSGSYAPPVPENWAQLTDDFYDNSSPDVCPDGKHIALQFSWIPSGAKWIDADGDVITPSGDGFLLWTEAVYVSGERIKLYQSGVCHISPDGKWLAVPSGWGEVEGRWTAITKACPVLGLSPCKSLIEGYRGFIRWSPDGEWIGFIDELREEGHIFVKHIPTNTLLELTKEKVYNEEGKISWFPDSRRIAFSTRLRGSEDLWMVVF